MSGLQERISAILDEHRPVHDPNGHINGTVPGSISVYDCWCERVVQVTLADCLAHVAELIAALFTTESQTLPVFVDNDPPEIDPFWHPPRVKRHCEFHTHTRHTTPWHSDDCPDCQTEPGVHDRRHREILAATQEQP